MTQSKMFFSSHTDRQVCHIRGLNNPEASIRNQSNENDELVAEGTLKLTELRAYADVTHWSCDS